MSIYNEYLAAKTPRSGDLTLYRKAVNQDLGNIKERPRTIVKLYGASGMRKAINFKIGNREFVYYSRERKPDTDNEAKLANNIIRSKTTILQLALCNKWEWFGSMTLDPAKYNRYDLDKFKTDLPQFLRNLRKKYKSKITYLLVPERHKDGAWHMHGFFSGIPREALSEFKPGQYDKTLKKLKDNNYLNWSDYAKKFGFVSLGAIRDPIKTAKYITKYITKDLATAVGGFGAHMHFATQKLARAENVAVYYEYEPELEKYCTYETEFCNLGWLPEDFGELPERDYYAREFGHRRVVWRDFGDNPIFAERDKDANMFDTNSVFVEETEPPYDVEQIFIDERQAAVRRAAEAEKARVRWKAYEEILAPNGVELYNDREFEQLELQTNISTKAIESIHKRGAYLK